MTDKWLIFLIHEELLQIDKENTYTLIEKWAKQREKEGKREEERQGTGKARGIIEQKIENKKWPLNINKIYSMSLIISKNKDFTDIPFFYHPI